MHVSRLDDAVRDAAMQQLPQWTYDADVRGIRRNLHFADFAEPWHPLCTPKPLISKHFAILPLEGGRSICFRVPSPSITNHVLPLFDLKILISGLRVWGSFLLLRQNVKIDPQNARFSSPDGHLQLCRSGAKSRKSRKSPPPPAPMPTPAHSGHPTPNDDKR